MKKITATILVLLLLMGNVCLAQETEQKSELEILKSYGIFEGDESGYRLNDNITKGEFIKMLAVSALYVDLTKQQDFSVDSEGSPVSSLNAYDDLTKEDWEYPYFLFLDIWGIEVISENKTNAKENLTYLDCCEYIIKILGYEVSKDDCAIKATNLGITKGLSVAINDACTRENAVKMISNALDVPICALKSYNVDTQTKEYTVLDGKDGREKRTLKTNLDSIKN